MSSQDSIIGTKQVVFVEEFYGEKGRVIGTPIDDYDSAALVMQNKQMKDWLNRLILFIDALEKGGEEVRLKAWSSKEDMRKAEAILYDALRSVLLPKDCTKL